MRGQLKLVICATTSKLTVTVLGMRSLPPACRLFTRPTLVCLKLSIVPQDERRTEFETVSSVANSSASFHRTFSFQLNKMRFHKRLLLSSWIRFDGNKNSFFIGSMSFGIRSLLAGQQIIEGWFYFLPATVGRRKHLACAIGNSSSRRSSKRRSNQLQVRTIKRCHDDPSNRVNLSLSQTNTQHRIVSLTSKKHHTFKQDNFQPNRTESRSTQVNNNVARPDLPLLKSEQNTDDEELFTIEKLSITRPCCSVARIVKVKNADQTISKRKSYSVSNDVNSRPFIKSGHFSGQQSRTKIKSELVKNELVNDEIQTYENAIKRLNSCEDADKKSFLVSLAPHSDDNTECNYSAEPLNAVVKPQTSSLTIRIKQNEETSYSTDDNRLKVSLKESNDHLSSSSSYSSTSSSAHDEHFSRLEMKVFIEEKAKSRSTLMSCNKKRRIFPTVSISALDRSSVLKSRLKQSKKFSEPKNETAKVASDGERVMKMKRRKLADSKIIHQNSRKNCNQKHSLKEFINSGRKEDNYKTRSRFIKSWISGRKNVTSESKLDMQKKIRMKCPFCIFSNKTLDEVLRSNHGISVFKKFLKKELSEENVEFWLECRSLENLKDGDDCKNVEDVFERYLRPGSQKEVNIDNQTRKIVEKNLQDKSENPFKEARCHVFELMKKDSFPRFIASQCKSCTCSAINT